MGITEPTLTQLYEARTVFIALSPMCSSSHGWEVKEPEFLPSHSRPTVCALAHYFTGIESGHQSYLLEDWRSVRRDHGKRREVVQWPGSFLMLLTRHLGP